MAFNTGTTSGNLAMAGYSQGGGLGTMGGKTKNQTLFAQLTAPPKPQGLLGFVVLLIVVDLLLSAAVRNVTGLPVLGLSFFGAGFLGIMYLTNQQSKKNKAIFNFKMRTWMQSWACRRCGNTFLIHG